MTGASNLKNLRISPLVLILMLFCPFSYGKVIYVDDDAIGANDGSSWADAYPCLQNALVFTQQGDEIRVAQGIYKPDQGMFHTLGYREATFRLINSIKLKGGYAGLSGPDPNERDSSLYKTILSGDLNGDDNYVNDPCDLLTEPTRAENSYNVVSGYIVNCLLDGFTISGGNANGSIGNPSQNTFGGGMEISLSPMTITNCTFKNNAARINGGALSSNAGSGPTLNNCIFTRNSGGSIVKVGSRVQIHGGGGGMYNNDNSPTLTNCMFIENFAPVGSGMYNHDSNLTLSNCTFSGNQALKFGGGMHNTDCNAVLTDCIFTANSAPSSGGGISNMLSNLTLTNCTFRENFTDGSGGAMHSSNCNITLIDCLLRGNFALSGGAIYNYGNDTTLNNCTFNENSTLVSGGGMYNVKANAMLTNCMFSGNRAEKYGGGMHNSDSSPSLIGCSFSGNTAADRGGGINNSNSIAGLTNCTLTGNSAEIGNALACDSPNQEYPSILEVINCIVWDGDNKIWNNDDSIIFIEYSDVQGGWPGEGGDNIDSDPLFVDADGDDNVIGTEDDDLRLLPGSPCIDTGENSAIPESVVTDAGGNPRIVNDTVDMGAYELSMGAIPGEIKYGGGTGESNDPYLIYTPVHLNTLGAEPNNYNKHFKLMADIDLGDYAPGKFNFIGELIPFTGVFDGNGHSISNFHYADADRSPLSGGLFSRVADPNVQIRNLTLIDPNISGKVNVGPLVGWMQEGAITNCHVIDGCVNAVFPTIVTDDIGGMVGQVDRGTITGCTSSCRVNGHNSVGGLIGYAGKTDGGGCVITNCRATGDVTGESLVGGLVGIGPHSIITCSYATGQVVGGWQVGGLLGSSGGGVTGRYITDCYATGSVSGLHAVGGLIGTHGNIPITRCYAAGQVINLSGEPDTSQHYIGGLIGSEDRADSTCFWDIETSGRTTSKGGIGLTTAEMQTAVTFLEAGWDFIGETENGTDDIWWIDEGRDYPRLWWEDLE